MLILWYNIFITIWKKYQILEVFKNEKIVRRIIALLLVLCLLTSCGVAANNHENASERDYTIYNCNGRVISFTTKIQIDKEGEYFGTIKGNLFKIVTDPLTFYDANGNETAFAGDTYHLFNQDSHGIYVNKQFTYDMVGGFEIFGQEYAIYDINEELVANLKFSPGNFEGKLTDARGNIIAEYTSFIGFKDFTIKIYDSCELDEISVLMIFGSYYSDYHYDAGDSN